MLELVNSKKNNSIDFCHFEDNFPSPYLFDVLESDLIIKNTISVNNQGGFLLTILTNIFLVDLTITRSSCLEPCLGFFSKTNVSANGIILSDLQNNFAKTGVISMLEANFILKNALFFNISSLYVSFIELFVSTIQINNCKMHEFNKIGIFSRNSIVSVSFLEASNVQGKQIDCFFIAVNSNFSMSYSKITDLLSNTFNYKGIFDAADMGSFLILNSKFINLNKKNLATFYIKSEIVVLQDNWFSTNKGNLGFCIYLDSFSYSKVNINFNTFQDNSAELGNSIFWNNFKPDLSRNKFLNHYNKSNIYSSPKQISMEIILESTNQTLYNSFFESNFFFAESDILTVKPKNFTLFSGFKIGISSDILFRFKLLDYYGNQQDVQKIKIFLVAFQKDFPYQINKTTEYLISSSEGTLHNNSYLFKNLIVFAQINHYYILTFQSEGFSPKFVFKVRFMLEGCKVGEQFDENSKQCRTCSTGFYSFAIDNNCKKCKPGMECLGGSKTNTKQGFWRIDKLSDDVVECFGKKTQCLENSQCEKGYTSKMCSKCEKNFFKIGMNTVCFRCKEFFPIFLALAIIKLFLVYMLLKIPKKHLFLNRKFILVMKMFLLFFFQSFVLNEFIINNDSNIFYFYSLAMNLISNHYSLLSINCLFEMNEYGKLTFYFLFFNFLIVSIGIYLKFAKLSETKRKKVVALAYFGYLMFIPTNMFLAFRALSCKKIEKEKYLLLDFDRNCSSEFYYAVSFFSSLTIFFTMIIPFVIFSYYLIKKKQRNEKTNMTFFLFFGGYTKKFWFWEIIVYFFSCLPIIFYGIFPSYPSGGILIHFLLIILQIMIENIKKIYMDSTVLKLQNIKNIHLIVIYLLQIFCFNTSNEKNAKFVFSVISLISVWLHVQLIAIFCLVFYYRRIRENFFQKLKKKKSNLKMRFNKNKENTVLCI